MVSPRLIEETKKPRYGKCPECRRTFSLKKDGRLRVHGYSPWPNGGKECPGSRGLPIHAIFEEPRSE